MYSSLVYPALGSLCFLYFVDYLISHIREVFSYYLLKYFLGSFLSSSLGTPIMQMLVHLMLSQQSLKMSPFFFHTFFYMLLCGTNFHHSLFQVTYLFFCLSYSAIDSCWCIIHLCLVFSFSRFLVDISCIFSILFLRPWVIFIIIILNSISGILPLSTSFIYLFFL